MRKRRIITFLLALVICLSVCLPGVTAYADGQAPASEQLVTLTINYYLYGTENLLAEPYIAQYPALEETAYSVTSPEIAGYALADPNQSVISGTLTQDTTVAVYYSSTQQTYG